MSDRTPCQCAFLTMSCQEGYTIDDELAIPPLQKLGVEVETLCWDDPDADWDRYDLVIVRSTWDYQERLDEFLETLARIDGSSAELQNPLALMRWNLDKNYLRDLEAQGIPTIPTLWQDRLKPGSLSVLLDELGTDSMILKPQVGAGAHGAWLLDRDNLHTHTATLEAWYRDCPLMAQAFVESVIREGEYSLIYFGGEFSHALQKTPKAGDFRSQEEHGSQLGSITPPPDLLTAAQRALATLATSTPTSAQPPNATPTPKPPLYARVDLVRANDSDAWWLIELELVEPSLYFSLDPAAPQRFAQALSRHLSA